jgi:ABC-type Fe3+-siderophore transport system permease subunit
MREIVLRVLEGVAVLAALIGGCLVYLAWAGLLIAPPPETAVTIALALTIIPYCIVSLVQRQSARIVARKNR